MSFSNSAADMYISDSSLGALLGKNAAQTRYILCEELTGRLGGERFLIDQLQLLELQMEYRTTLSFEGKAAWFCLFYFFIAWRQHVDSLTRLRSERI